MLILHDFSYHFPIDFAMFKNYYEIFCDKLNYMLPEETVNLSTHREKIVI